MAELVLDINVSGEESIDADFKAFQKELISSVEKAMDDVGADMIEALKKHIETDVYKAYPNPKEYERRSKNSELGRALNDMKANTTVYNKGAGVSLEYKPTGEHENSAWHTADGDDLIGRIEKKNPPYFKKAQGMVPERPFWQNFVNEMIEGEELERFFVSAMLMRGVEIEESGGVVRESGDGDY